MAEKPQPFTTNGVDKYRVKENIYANSQRRYIPELQLASYVHFENESIDAGWINIAAEEHKKGYFLLTDAKMVIKKRKELN